MPIRNYGSPLIIILLIVAIALAVLVFEVVALWKVFEKAGKPGWASLVPFYNGWTLAEIGGKPGWWGLLAGFSFSFRNTTSSATPKVVVMAVSLLALVSFIFFTMISLGVAKKFGKSTGFGILLVLLSFITYPILGFGSATYNGSDKKDTKQSPANMPGQGNSPVPPVSPTPLIS